MEKTFRYVHLALMVLVVLFSIVSMVLVINGSYNRAVVLASEEKTVVWFYIFLNFFIALGVGCAMVYFFRGSSKHAATHYKAFMLLLMCACFCEILMSVRDLRLTADIHLWGQLAFNIVKAVILLVLGVGLDHGKTDTHVLFWILLIADIALIVLSFKNGMTTMRILGIIARLMTDACIFFTIRNKYLDKARRGRK